VLPGPAGQQRTYYHSRQQRRVGRVERGKATIRCCNSPAALPTATSLRSPGASGAVTFEFNTTGEVTAGNIAVPIAAGAT